KLRLEGDRVEGSGLLDLNPASDDAASDDEASEDEKGEAAANPTPNPLEKAGNASREFPAFGFDMDRQSGRLQVSVEGRGLNASHLNAIERLAPVTVQRPPLLEDSRWEASGNAVWQRAGFRERGGWHGQLLVRGLSIPVNGLASPVVFSAAPLQLRGDAWKVTGASAKVDGIAVKVDATVERAAVRNGENATRQLALRLAFDELTLAQLQE